MKYQEYKAIQPTMNNCFFAFSKQQYDTGIRKHCLHGLKLFDGGFGLVGTKQGIQDFYDQYDKIDDAIKNDCDPQEVYNYEFSNHECSYTNDDEEAIKIVAGIFGVDKAMTVKRKYAYYKLHESTI